MRGSGGCGILGRGTPVGEDNNCRKTCHGKARGSTDYQTREGVICKRTHAHKIIRRCLTQQIKFGGINIYKKSTKSLFVQKIANQKTNWANTWQHTIVRSKYIIQ